MFLTTNEPETERKKTMTLRPTSVCRPWSELAVYGFGRSADGFQIGDFSDPYSFAKVVEACKLLGIKTVYCTQASDFSATICRPEDFPTKFIVGDVTIMTGVRASGCVVPRGAAAFRSSADCPTMVTQNLTGEVVVTHAGRDELIDRHRVQTGKPDPNRKYESVVDAIADYLGHGFKHLQVWAGFGIWTGFRHATTDPRYGKLNSALRQYALTRWGSPCLADDDLLLTNLIRDQWCNRYGVQPSLVQRDEVNTKEDIGPDGEYLYYSRVREPKDNKTNGIFVVVD